MTSAPPPYRHRRALTRLLDRHRRVVAALLAAAALLSAVLAVRPPPEPAGLVLVAARDLDATSPLAAGDLAPRPLPSDAVPDGALPADTEAAGLSLTSPVRRGEVITDARLSDPPAGPYGPGLVAVPVRVSDPGAVGLLSPGSRVDVLAAGSPDEFAPVRAGPAVEVVSDRPVLALPAESDRGGGGGALILIAATPAEARSLAGHATASRLSITIRG
ncbi:MULTISPECIES: SAF domain-containing protein [Nocardiopsidaceae]|jgi:Flp pilus assembly protein CpaB|uniref:Flp pilus assembly protein CpaB n=2 Tax=Nocardiopsidaceae TaxID=83676 RepID=A0ABY6YQL5_9ACTN|nr:SAF domain-containing protein [Streptomonospora nanhaiensis]MEE2045575.1 Flp pilus assembly protein CpaB [Nocardiopsis tropica]WAE74246.1 Flp pilus assembly protein CpaB [Streptomonospora nanhaiensis]